MSWLAANQKTKMISYDLDFGYKIHIKLAKNVRNSRDIFEHLKSGQLNCALIRPHLILDPFQIAIAANKAVCTKATSNLITKSIHGEIIFNLCNSRNISASFKDFGMRVDDSDFLVVIIGNEQSAEEICGKIDCVYEFPSCHKLKNYNDESAISKYYKISEVELSISDLLSAVVSRIAAKFI